jgi:hypothetical protein
MARDFIKELGGYRAVAQELDISPGRVANWSHPSRQIPWRYRMALARMAREKRVELPDGFLDH